MQRAALVVFLALVAVALRLPGLADWSLSDDEYWSRLDSENFQWVRVRLRPLYYAINHFVVGPVLGFDEVGLRVAPFLAGVLAVPLAFYLLAHQKRPLLGFTVGLLIAVSAWHVYWSQFARYYSIAFLMTLVFGIALIGLTSTGPRWWAAVAVASGTLGMLAHPSALLPVLGSLAGYGLASWRHVRRRGTIWAAVLVVGVAIAAAYQLGPTLIYRILRPGGACCHLPLSLALSHVDWMTAPISVLAAVGLFGWYARDRASGWVVLGGVAAPVFVLGGLSVTGAVSLSYMFPATPFLFLSAAGLLVDFFPSPLMPARARWLWIAIVVAIGSANLVGLASHYRDGGRLPYRSALPDIAQRMDAATMRLALEGRRYTQIYAPMVEGVELPADSSELRALVRDSAAVLVLAPRVERAGFGYYAEQFGQVYAWLSLHCRLTEVYGRPRLDFRRNALELYDCSSHRTRAEQEDAPLADTGVSGSREFR